tara:strand:- start:33274 stop:33594 length:321 start_codon:yes stop_codon:yes gene_type:complete
MLPVDLVLAVSVIRISGRKGAVLGAGQLTIGIKRAVAVQRVFRSFSVDISENRIRLAIARDTEISIPLEPDFLGFVISRIKANRLGGKAACPGQGKERQNQRPQQR